MLKIKRLYTFMLQTFLPLFLMTFGRQMSNPLLLTIFIIFAVTLSASLLLDYTYTTELFDIKVRATGVGFVITMSRFGAAAGTFVLPVIIEMAGPYVTMLVCGVVLLLGTVICAWLAPETNPKLTSVKA